MSDHGRPAPRLVARALTATFLTVALILTVVFVLVSDAITSARAYRPARLPQEAIGELQRLTGTDFDGAAVAALISVLPRLPAATSHFDPGVLQWRMAASSAS